MEQRQIVNFHSLDYHWLNYEFPIIFLINRIFRERLYRYHLHAEYKEAVGIRYTVIK